LFLRKLLALVTDLIWLPDWVKMLSFSLVAKFGEPVV